ncbi:kinase-like domain-containing protein [Chaetomium sp. MPI-SDFR-AT-0129]|nr:kinase-like domain-containing protein [Chaetomium sp. MPI-SDFR-AT-0129]
MDPALIPHRGTLFHLVPRPRNEPAKAALTHDDNRKFVSMAASNRPGLEVGFHVPLYSHGPVITRLGRDADLILPGSSCGVHVDFRISGSTKLLKLTVRFVDGDRPTVFVRTRGDGDGLEHSIRGDCVLFYGHKYSIAINDYDFELQRTLYQATMDPVVTEAPGSRRHIGAGSFGSVYEAKDWHTGGWFAVKELDIRKLSTNDPVKARCLVHRVVAALWLLRHVNIIELGNLASLVSGGRTPAFIASVHEQFMPQMLSALDFLAFNGYAHRDVKPENILYNPVGEPDKYHFKLADFGLTATYHNSQTFCGTNVFLAPEFRGREPRTSKVDIWSLFVTLVAVTPAYRFNATRNDTPDVIFDAIQAAAATPCFQKFRTMARRDPNDRPSAAQLLKLHYRNVGQVRPQQDIPDISPDSEIPPPPENPLVLALPPLMNPPCVYTRVNRLLNPCPCLSFRAEILPRAGILHSMLGLASTYLRKSADGHTKKFAVLQRNLRTYRLSKPLNSASFAHVRGVLSQQQRQQQHQRHQRHQQQTSRPQTPPPGGAAGLSPESHLEPQRHRERPRVPAPMPSPEQTPAREYTMMDIDSFSEGYPFR